MSGLLGSGLSRFQRQPAEVRLARHLGTPKAFGFGQTSLRVYIVEKAFEEALAGASGRLPRVMGRVERIGADPASE
jgi:hypothetical protein